MQTPDMQGIPIGPEHLIEAMQRVVTMIPGSDLTQLFQVVVGEMFIRSSSPADFVEKWSATEQHVRTFFDPENCPAPDILEDYLKEQAELARQKEVRFSNAFEDEATSELEGLFKKHGVVEEKREDPDTPGQYL